ncbi:sporulation YhaL family protein [Anaerobacillus sp. HL2]|nr:sporulation YhaL family protein [Anaerobacillus sp. HL2]
MCYFARVVLLITPIAEKIQVSPWWVYSRMGGILLSGYLSLKYTQEDKKVELDMIQQEGELYMEPIRKRRRERNCKRKSMKKLLKE